MRHDDVQPTQLFTSVCIEERATYLPFLHFGSPFRPSTRGPDSLLGRGCISRAHCNLALYYVAAYTRDPFLAVGQEIWTIPGGKLLALCLRLHCSNSAARRSRAGRYGLFFFLTPLCLYSLVLEDAALLGNLEMLLQHHY